MNFNYTKKTISTTDSNEDSRYNYLSNVMLKSLRDNMEMVEKICSGFCIKIKFFFVKKYFYFKVNSN
jgi:hypothetical protein